MTRTNEAEPGAATRGVGDLAIVSKLPTGAGSLTQWTPGGSAPAATNWEGVDDAAPDDAVTLNSTTGVGNADLFAMADLSAGTPAAVMVKLRHAKDDAGASAIAALIKSGGTTAQGADLTPTTSWQSSLTNMPNDPATGAPWASIAALNAAEVGYKRTG
ncbi:MAG TPA: hypothetical protein VFS05_03100 [Gemmatimonadaceae bacterium]|nr:hypothetical protein [Gemmatimonadaceae bacterium]